VDDRSEKDVLVHQFGGGLFELRVEFLNHVGEGHGVGVLHVGEAEVNSETLVTAGLETSVSNSRGEGFAPDPGAIGVDGINPNLFGVDDTRAGGVVIQSGDNSAVESLDETLHGVTGDGALEGHVKLHGSGVGQSFGEALGSEAAELEVGLGVQIVDINTQQSPSSDSKGFVFNLKGGNNCLRTKAVDIDWEGTSVESNHETCFGF